MNYNFLKNENDKVFYDVLDRLFFKSWKNHRVFHKTIELFITAQCNLQCEYCYLNKYGNLLYPLSIDNNENILKNIQKVIKWINKNEYIVEDISLFSGEIWHTDFGIKILEIVYNELKNNKYVRTVVIPTNGSFVQYEKYYNIISKYIDKFKKIGKKLILSFSVDGLPVESNSRTSKDKKDYEKFYEKLFEFHLNHPNSVGFHPMIASCNADKFIENYKWWKEQKNNYNITRVKFLEVRNSDWTQETLKKYIEFIEYYFYDEIELANNNENFINKILGMIHRDYFIFYLEEYDDRYACSIQSLMTIRCGDLSIVPCHRMSYDKFVAGKLIIDDDGNLENIICNNCEFYFKTYITNPNLSQIKCDTCEIAPLCCKGCIGAQYEYFKEPFSPIPSVCNLLKTRTYTLIYLLNKENLVEYIGNMDFNTPSGYPLTNIYFDICKIMESDEYKEYERYKSS